LKSTYYCFIEKTIQGEKYTQKVNKRWTRTWFGGKKKTTNAVAPVAKAWFATKKVEANLEDIDLEHVTDDDKAKIEAKLRAEKGDDYVEQLKAWTLYDGNCPIDPFEAVMCTSCQ
jgi:ribonucleoside-diphosphate reductase alpha chain